MRRICVLRVAAERVRHGIEAFHATKGGFGMRMRFAAVLVAVAATSGCMTGVGDGELIADPYEAENRAIHRFNKGLDTALVRPASQAYDFATPAVVKHLVGNAIDHLRLPGMFVNYLLQGELESAAATFGRFGVNTIVGAAGLLDPATEFDLPLEPTDFGLTLASYGVEEGVYIELPLFGPTTSRGAVGKIVDMALSPTTYLGPAGAPAAVGPGVTATTIIHQRDAAREFIDPLFYESEDSYVAIRTVFIQNRRLAVSGGVSAEEDLPDIFSE